MTQNDISNYIKEAAFIEELAKDYSFPYFVQNEDLIEYLLYILTINSQIMDNKLKDIFQNIEDENNNNAGTSPFFWLAKSKKGCEILSILNKNKENNWLNYLSAQHLCENMVGGTSPFFWLATSDMGNKILNVILTKNKLVNFIDFDINYPAIIGPEIFDHPLLNEDQFSSVFMMLVSSTAGRENLLLLLENNFLVNKQVSADDLWDTMQVGCDFSKNIAPFDYIMNNLNEDVCKKLLLIIFKNQSDSIVFSQKRLSIIENLLTLKNGASLLMQNLDIFLAKPMDNALPRLKLYKNSVLSEADWQKIENKLQSGRTVYPNIFEEKNQHNKGKSDKKSEFKENIDPKENIDSNTNKNVLRKTSK